MTPEQAHAACLDDVVAAGGVDVAVEIAGTDDAIAIAMHAAAAGRPGRAGRHPGRRPQPFPASVARRKGLTILMSRRMNGTYPRTIALVRRGGDRGRIDRDRAVRARRTSARRSPPRRRGPASRRWSRSATS